MIPFRPFAGVHGEFLGRGEPHPEINMLKQVHGDTVRVIRDGAVPAGQEGDALITALPRVTLAVRTADCLPILLAHPAGVVAAVHAGWRGTLAGIAAKAVKTFVEEFSLDPSELYGSIGPAICGQCFELGEDVARSFRANPFAGDLLKPKGEKFLLDLKTANRRQLEASGMDSRRLKIVSACTLCEEDKYFSHRGAVLRGEKTEGRNIAWIARKQPGKET